jgi:tetratricopeptide (TPR) repeat protein
MRTALHRLRHGSRGAALFVAVALLSSGCRDSPVDLMRKAKMSVYEKDPRAALQHYRAALDLIERDASPEAPVLKARALRGAADVYRLELGNVKEAIAVYRELIAQCPEAPESLEARIILSELLEIHYHDLRGAITELTAALARNPPESAELHYHVATLYLALQDYQQAELEAQLVATRYEASAYADDGMLLRAQALAMMERRAEAMKAFEDLAQRFPDSELAPHALFELGKLKAEAGENEKAIEIWVAALKSHPQPQIVQAAIARLRQRILRTTPAGVGESAAFDYGTVAIRHASSLEALAAPSLDGTPGRQIPEEEPVPPSGEDPVPQETTGQSVTPE